MGVGLRALKGVAVMVGVLVGGEVMVNAGVVVWVGVKVRVFVGVSVWVDEGAGVSVLPGIRADLQPAAEKSISTKRRPDRHLAELAFISSFRCVSRPSIWTGNGRSAIPNHG